MLRLKVTLSCFLNFIKKIWKLLIALDWHDYHPMPAISNWPMYQLIMISSHNYKFPTLELFQWKPSGHIAPQQSKLMELNTANVRSSIEKKCLDFLEVLRGSPLNKGRWGQNDVTGNNGCEMPTHQRSFQQSVLWLGTCDSCHPILPITGSPADMTNST